MECVTGRLQVGPTWVVIGCVHPYNSKGTLHWLLWGLRPLTHRSRITDHRYYEIQMAIANVLVLGSW